MSRYTRLVNAACLIGQPLLLNALSVPATAYIIRQLGSYGYGQWMVATSLAGFTAFIANLGLRTLFVRAIAQDPDQAEEALAEQLGLRLLLALLAGSIVVALVLCLGYPQIVCQCAILAAVGLVFTTLSCALADVLQGFQQFRLFAGVNLVAGLLLTLVSVAVIRCGLGPVGLSAAYLAGPLVSFCLFLWLVHSRFFPVRMQWNWPRYRELLQEVRLMGFQQFLTSVQERVEQLLIPKMVGISAFGYFSAGSMPASRLIVFPDGLATAQYPKIARSHQEAGAGQEVSRLLTLTLIACLPLALFLTFAAGPIAQILFPKNPQLCRQIIQITIWGVPLLGISMPMTYALQAVGQHRETARASMVAICGTVALSLFLVSRFGIFGACWCWVLRPFVSAASLLPRFVNTFPLVIKQIPLGRVVYCNLLLVGIFLFAAELTPSALWSIVVTFLLALTAYVTALILLRVVHLSEISTRRA